MQDKVVMGDQKDGLRGLTRFSDNEGDIIWPAWRAELKQRVAFEFGKIGNQIIEGEVKESDVDLGEVTEKINALINAYDMRVKKLKEMQALGIIVVKYCVTAKMLADLFTKNVNAVIFSRLSNVLTGA
jgi:hypothetical protein